MAISEDEVLKFITLDLDSIPQAQRDDAKQAVADFIREQMLIDLSKSISPVTGKKFKPLSADYKADKAKVSPNAIPNMELGGSMLDALEANLEKGNRISIGWTDPDQTPKAFNHTTGDTLPQRPLIPSPKEDFRAGIMEGIEAVLDDFRVT